MRRQTAKPGKLDFVRIIIVDYDNNAKKVVMTIMFMYTDYDDDFYLARR